VAAAVRASRANLASAATLIWTSHSGARRAMRTTMSRSPGPTSHRLADSRAARRHQLLQRPTSRRQRGEPARRRTHEVSVGGRETRTVTTARHPQVDGHQGPHVVTQGRTDDDSQRRAVPSRRRSGQGRQTGTRPAERCPRSTPDQPACRCGNAAAPFGNGRPSSHASRPSGASGDSLPQKVLGGPCTSPPDPPRPDNGDQVDGCSNSQGQLQPGASSAALSLVARPIVAAIGAAAKSDGPAGTPGQRVDANNGRPAKRSGRSAG
jgi:hypothetical protein